MNARDHGSYIEDIIEHMNYAEEFINNLTFENSPMIKRPFSR